MPNVVSAHRLYFNINLKDVLDSASSEHPLTHVQVSVTSMASNSTFSREIDVSQLDGDLYRVEGMISPNTAYSVRLRTRNSAGSSAWSPPSSVTTWTAGRGCRDVVPVPIG